MTFQVPYGILPDHKIRYAVEHGDIEIDPYNPANVNPVSYDLTLGDELMIYKRWVTFDHTLDEPGQFGGPNLRQIATGKPRDGGDFGLDREWATGPRYLDVKDEPEVQKFKIDREHGWILKPGIGYLMHTHERILTTKYVPVLDGKSSIGRLFMVVHVTAGYGDPGFNGQYTLEVTVTHPLKIYPGMKIAQMRFHTIAGIDGCEKPYDGNYTGRDASGPVPSKAWRQFRR